MEDTAVTKLTASHVQIPSARAIESVLRIMLKEDDLLTFCSEKFNHLLKFSGTEC